MKTLHNFFLKPEHQMHRKYEAARALYVENKKAKEIAKMFGYSIHTVNSIKKDFSKL